MGISVIGLALSKEPFLIGCVTECTEKYDCLAQCFRTLTPFNLLEIVRSSHNFGVENEACPQ